MRHLLFVSAAVLMLCFSVNSAQASTPNLNDLQLVAELPKELPQRVMGLAYDGEQLWATVYLGRGAYAKLNPTNFTWTLDDNVDHHRVIADVAGAFASPGGVCFANNVMWIVGSYGQSFGSIHRETWKVDRIFKVLQHTDTASQSYSSVAFDGKNLWIVWHWFKYSQPTSKTQLLLKVDPNTGNVIAEYPVPPGTRNDGVHGLTWDGARLWHIKDQRLSAIDPDTGTVTAQYIVNGVTRPSGLA